MDGDSLVHCPYSEKEVFLCVAQKGCCIFSQGWDLNFFSMSWVAKWSIYWGVFRAVLLWAQVRYPYKNTGSKQAFRNVFQTYTNTATPEVLNCWSFMQIETVPAMPFWYNSYCLPYTILIGAISITYLPFPSVNRPSVTSSLYFSFWFKLFVISWIVECTLVVLIDR